jgi:hypothetical protein
MTDDLPDIEPTTPNVHLLRMAVEGASYSAGRLSCLSLGLRLGPDDYDEVGIRLYQGAMAAKELAMRLRADIAAGGEVPDLSAQFEAMMFAEFGEL